MPLPGPKMAQIFSFVLEFSHKVRYGPCLSIYLNIYRVLKIFFKKGQSLKWILILKEINL